MEKPDFKPQPSGSNKPLKDYMQGIGETNYSEIERKNKRIPFIGVSDIDLKIMEKEAVESEDYEKAANIRDESLARDIDKKEKKSSNFSKEEMDELYKDDHLDQYRSYK